jgi:hypothetical protein
MLHAGFFMVVFCGGCLLPFILAYRYTYQVWILTIEQLRTSRRSNVDAQEDFSRACHNIDKNQNPGLARDIASFAIRELQTGESRISRYLAADI